MKYKLIRKPSGTVGGALYTMDVKTTETLVQKPVQESTEVEVRNEGGAMSSETEEEIRNGGESRDQGQELYVAEDIEGGKTKSPSFLGTMRIFPRKRKVANKPELDHETAEQEQTTTSADVMEKTEQPSIPESSKPIAPSCNLVKKKELSGLDGGKMRCAQADDNDNLVSVKSQDRPKTTVEVANGVATTARAAALDDKFNYDENISLEESAIRSQRSTTETDGYSRSEYDSDDSDDDSDDDDDDESDGEEDQTVLIDSSTVTERKIETGWFSGFRVLPDIDGVGAVGASDPTIVANRDSDETKEPEDPIDPKSTDECSGSPDGSTMTPIFFDVTKVVESPQEEVVREEQKEFGLDEYRRQQKADFRRKWLRLVTLRGVSRRSFPTRNCSKNRNSSRLGSSDGTPSFGNPPSQVRQIGVRRPLWRPVLALKNAGASIHWRFWKRKDRCIPPKDGKSHSDQNDDDDVDDGLSVYSKELSSHPKSDDDPWGIFVSFWTSTVTCPGG
ncbi:hypothetical protein IV203_014083 [Nitzschia inconspicua]|uniref:Uncharacterized protein n=1 Tax=Nitzschia inconspicua TaxID=303405 RepID=A0A9K3M7A3_9STRA|nr:hypothetical protein IV203_014083 [Nitzschia inconspicua]